LISSEDKTSKEVEFKMAIHFIPLLLAGSLMLVACQPSAPPAPAAPARPAVEPALLTRGQALYTQHCAACHGDRAQGAFAWERPGADGKYPAPPLDGSAHAWHHPTAQLKQTIREGTLKLGGNMPAWKGKLTEADTQAVIAWFQSTWPDPIYAAWADIDRRSRADR
jgi:mono/diheme cytochrome c family protein